MTARDVVSSGVQLEKTLHPSSHGCWQDSAPRGLSDWGPQFIAAYWLETIPCSPLFGALYGAAHLIRANEGQHLDKESTGKTEVMIPYNVITNVTSELLCHILWVRSKSWVLHTVKEVG